MKKTGQVQNIELTSAAWFFLFGVASIKKNFSSPVAGGLYSAFFLVVMSAFFMGPLYGKVLLSLSEFLNRCEFKGMAFHVIPRKN